MEQVIYGSEWPHYYADEADARLDLVAEVRTGAMHPTVAERKLRRMGLPCSRAAREDFREARRAYLDATLPRPIAQHPIVGTDVRVWDAIIPLARGSYQRNLLHGYESWSGASLRGKARRWGASYARSRRSLWLRLSDADVASPDPDEYLLHTDFHVGQVERNGRIGLIFTDTHGRWAV